MKNQVLPSVLTLFCCAVLGTMQVKAQTVANVALSHNGNLTLYNADDLQTAVDASVNGDTLFLSSGSFPSCTISKRISLIGAGQNTIVNSVTINTTGTLTSRILDAMKVTNNIVLQPSSTLSGVSIRKCYAGSIYGYANLTNILVDRCYFGSFYFENKPTNMRITNSILGTGKVSSTVNSIDDIILVNCNVYAANNYNYPIRGNFINCIVYGSYVDNSFFTSCFLTGSINANNQQNCQQGTLSNTYYPEQWTTTMTGTDGTPVGITGGANPFTLVPSSPEMESYTLNVDSQNRKLDVTIKMATK